MPRPAIRRNKYPGHGTGLPVDRQQLPQQGPAAPVEATPAAATTVDGGELAASPWVGLHYATERT
ncbi:hypothetical protein [Arthrobacter sp. Y81]|uniref:hypothetical protein n=1 Tax=Arthrobacter sp. Y81 TaxID=2058897 RepID=UPI000CE37B90|nr:hypothetical protein [Arthrobacter sp. Y81]